MDPLSNFILNRVNCKMHPFFLGGWKEYPPHLAEVLRGYEVLHVVGITMKHVVVDGVAVADERGMKVKFECALDALFKGFGEPESEEGRAFNVVVFKVPGPHAVVSYFRGPVWFAALCVEKRACQSRFAFVAEPDSPCITSRVYRGVEGEVYCVVATPSGADVGFHVSEKFFLNPSPENASVLGDLLFLAQMMEGDWIVDSFIDPNTRFESTPWSGRMWLAEDPYVEVAKTLRGARGLKGLLKTIALQALLCEPHEIRRWRKLMALIGEGGESDAG